MTPVIQWRWLKLYWASPRHRFTHPGLHLWLGAKRGHVRVLPWPKAVR
jgi:hypothetical protein